MNKLIAVTLASYIITAFVYFTMDTSIFETPISPANHWIPEVFTFYFFGIFYAKFLSKMARNIAILSLVAWQIFTILFFPSLGILVIIPLGFLMLLLGVFCLGYKKGNSMTKQTT